MNKIIILLLFISLTVKAQINYRLEINRLNIPFSNDGVIGSVYNFGDVGGFLDDKPFLFSAGFFLSGLNADTIWANGVAPSARVGDYQPGNVDSLPYDPRHINYVVTKWDTPFGDSWQTWRYAVSLGADFYDGNNDGIFNPVDMNGNNLWDPNEDKPDLIGDIAVWCIYNDGPDTLRIFKNKPLGIEIQQTVFAFYSEDDNYDPRSCSFFVRYEIINTGKVSDVFDSVYFGGWADTDLGITGDALFDDLTGCDTLNNSGFVYNVREENPDWGINPPAHFIKILQGPHSYIPGETFIDNNSNGKYDEAFDTPLDSSYNYKGTLGFEIIPGANNLGMTSFTPNTRGVFNMRDPHSHIEARNYMLGGIDKFGEPFDPCTLIFGEVYGGVPCAQINPEFIYSGDPVTQTGWVNTFGNDQRQMVNTGPFILKVGEPVNIIVAHIAARGYDNLNSITVGKKFSSSLDGFLKSNFTDIVVSVDDDRENPILQEFALHQNYPNPFNPVTTIRYSIPNVETRHASFLQNVTLKVYDILGREVITLLNEEKPAGSYKVEFNGSKLSSGIYFYELRAGDFSSIRKMILLK